MKRIVYRIKYRKTEPLFPWQNGATHTLHCTQADAVRYAIAHARADRSDGRLAQVVLHGKDGRIRWERTYGRDPKRRKG